MSKIVSASEVEQERQQLLEDLVASEGSEFLERFKPGSFGCHELLDRANLIGDTVEESILNHPACLQNAEWYALAEQAVSALRELYQRVGSAEPAEPDGEEAIA